MDGWQRLGEEIIKRRVELGLITQQAFASSSRLSSRLLSDLERGRRHSYDPATLVRLERALRWTPGSVQAVLDGGQPTPLPEERDTRLVERAGDDLEMVSMLASAGLDQASALRIVMYIRSRRAQQHAQLLGEVRQLIAEAGGIVDDVSERKAPRPRQEKPLPHEHQPPTGLGGNARVPHGDLPQ